MKTYYMVKETSIATSANPNFAGETAIAYIGRNEALIAYVGDHPKKTGMYKELHAAAIKEYGYTRKCDAVRAYAYKNPENTDFWQSTAEIVEMEIAI